MKKLLAVTIALCFLCSVAAAKEAQRRQLKMMDSSVGVSDEVRKDGMFGVAQSGTTWIGWSPSGTGPHSIGAPGYWDFDDRGTLPCPVEDDYQEYIKNGAYAQGWTSEDVLAQKGLFWHAEDYSDPGFACSANPLGGTYSAWCGKVAPAPLECFTNAPGYGSNWNQWLCRSVTMDLVAPSLSYDFNSDTEPGFDYCYVFIDSEFPDSCGWVGEDADTLRCYDGPNSGSESIDLTAWADGADCDDIPFKTDYSGDSVKICFVVVSDGGWDDEDGTYDTCDGAFNVDDIVINTALSSGDSIKTNFETATLEDWQVCGGFSPGDYAAIRSQWSFLNHDDCGFENCTMEGCVLAFWNPNVPGQYGNGGHYGSGSFYKRAWSPPIDLTPYPDRGYVMAFERYEDLPIPNWIFRRHHVKYVQDPDCPAGAWSPQYTDSYVYYMPIPGCNDLYWGCSQYIPVDADSMKVGLSAWNGCEVWETQCTEGNESPVFDNVKLGIWDLSAPLASIRAVDNYTDAFPEADDLVATHTGLIDAANNKSQEGYFLRLADSAVVRLEAPNCVVEFCFRVCPGPGTNLADPFFTVKYPGAWAPCDTSDMFCTRMDTAFAAGDGDTSSAYETQVVFEGYFATMIHEADPLYVGEGEEILPDSLFTPGTKIFYAFRTSYLPGPGPYNYLPFGADLTNDPATGFEVEVLPDLCKDPPACLLYVDYYNRGAQGPIQDALTALGRTWDRFDLRAESSHQANGIGNRLLGPGRYRLARGPIGPSLAHLAQYRVMLVNSGNFGSGVCFSDGGKGTPDDPSNDITFLDDWIQEGVYKGLWMSGNNIANDFSHATGGSPKPGFLANELGTTLVTDDLLDLINWDILNDNCICVKTRDGEVSAADPQYEITNKYAVPDSFSLFGIGCPAVYRFDVVEDNEGSPGNEFISAMYCGRYPASVDNVFKAANPPFDTVRTRVDGFSVHDLRDNYPDCAGAERGIALWIRDVLGGNNNNGFFHDKLLGVQYCPPQGAEDPTLDVPRGGKTYANALFQNYPNPFRSGAGTTIHYSVSKPGAAEIRVFDVAGRLVATLTHRAKLGDNLVVWDGVGDDGRSVPSGVYFYQIKAGDFAAHKKMLLVR
jgi:hypothetical protein